ncbi:hypothetical protein CLDAP_18920 [Caldilinea aerophila DSM 14535 = NBRC 104270]|uniref:Uncharacterized protein n=1 Tax=Caldilinea aerophila (strain DSM 14535 / JCM 11387 / NBRC 104270 / STL-6-O1) TaxID=926550 RepID=I0I3U4_CALAS|nr:hypothetical protein CLDAP_18920 [Caldilinea aerophila DSM 14535 = NBRC 104270]
MTQPPTLPQLASHQEASPRRRKARRKARSRQRAVEEQRASAGTEAEVEYIPPLSVFIYTHTTHPEMRDSYEFRPEHFSRGGRRIEDFHIDISSLFVEDSGNAEDSTPLLKGLPKPKFNWADWEEEE